MVAPSEDNEIRTRGAFGEPLRQSHGISLTTEELRALKWAARFTSVGMYLRHMIGQDKFEDLIRETKRARKQAAQN